MLTAVPYTTCPVFLHLHVSSLLAQPSTFPMCTCAFVRDNEGNLFAARNSIKVMCHQIKKNIKLVTNGALGWRYNESHYFISGVRSMSTSTVRVCGRLRDSELPVSHLYICFHHHATEKKIN